MKASDVTQRAVEWLWWPYVPLGKLTTVAGQMGQAKSIWTLWLAAQVTRGGLGLDEPGSVIVLSAEDDADDTTVPRLEAAGADLNRVWLEPSTTLEVPKIERLCDELSNLRLVTIDPVQAFLPNNVDSWKGQHVRRELDPLRRLASARRFSAVTVQHLNRNANVVEALARINDSQGIPALARSVLIWGPDPADEEGDQGNMKVLVRAKGNLARATAAATYTLGEKQLSNEIAAPFLTRGNDRNVDADDVVADLETRTAKEEAAAWLRELLSDGPLPAAQVIKLGLAEGFSDRTLKRAKKPAGVVSRSIRDGDNIASWQWLLKDDGHVGHVGHVGTLDGQEVQEGQHIRPDLTVLNGGKELKEVA